MSEEKIVQEEAMEQVVNATKRPKRVSRKKVCNFCVDKIENIDYKDITSTRYSISYKRLSIYKRWCLYDI
jgi:small subunit ribosomal protein S18